MADPSKSAARPPSPSAGRDSPRAPKLRVAGKLTALLGLPLLVLFSIFASGVYCGAVRADRIVELEQRWLGIEPPAGRLVAVDNSHAGATDEANGTGDAVDEPSTEPDVAGDPGDATAEPKLEPKPTDTEPKPEPTTTPAKPEPASALKPAQADPVGAELRSRFEEPRVVRLKIMVDPALVVAREDWLGYVAQLFEATRVSYERLFGIDLQLHGVVVWDDAVGASVAALEADLATRERDGADVMLGLLARARPSDFKPPQWTADVTGDHALVFADLQQPDRHYRSLLRALTLLFGAEPAVSAEAKQLGSFMSDGVPASTDAPVLDPENRGKIIINKRRPIATPAPAPERLEQETDDGATAPEGMLESEDI